MQKKPTQALLLLLAASALGSFPITAEEHGKSAAKTTEQIEQEQTMACLAAVDSQILRQLNPKVPTYNRFSRVLRPMPLQHYIATVTSCDGDGVVSFEIQFVDRMAKSSEPSKTVAASGRYQSRSGELFLTDEKTGKPVPAAEHQLLSKRKPQTLP